MKRKIFSVFALTFFTAGFIFSAHSAVVFFSLATGFAVNLLLQP